MERIFDMIIVGAGPAGLAAAIVSKIANPETKVALMEKKEVPGKKLSASGNGRGNLSNKDCDCLTEVLKFFTEAGVAIRMDQEGRIYPYSEEAKAVTEALVKRARSLGVKIFTEFEVRSVEADPEGGFRIFALQRQSGASLATGKKKDGFRAKKVLLSTGGKSFATYGSTGDGYGFARSLGHRVTPLVPALTAIEVEEDLSTLKGLRVKGEARLFTGGDLIFKEVGEIQFKEDSLSGICIMNMSSHLPVAVETQKDSGLSDCTISLNLVPDFSPWGLMDFLYEEQKLHGAMAFDLLETLVKKPLALYVLKVAGIEVDTKASELCQDKLLTLANALRGLAFTPCGRKGWKEAQVTKGGVDLKEISLDTMESKLIPGLYFAGEVLDYDGPCGGYNLHNAWFTGIKAGKDMASHV